MSSMVKSSMVMSSMVMSPDGNVIDAYMRRSASMSLFSPNCSQQTFHISPVLLYEYIFWFIFWSNYCTALSKIMLNCITIMASGCMCNKYCNLKMIQKSEFCIESPIWQRLFGNGLAQRGDTPLSETMTVRTRGLLSHYHASRRHYLGEISPGLDNHNV